MATPSQPKGIKPKAELSEASATTGGSELTIQKLIIANIVVTVLICILFIGSTYVIVSNTVNKSVKEITDSFHGEGAGEEGGDEETHMQRGIILDLGEFILNLSDPSIKRYLKVNVALELSRAATDPVIAGHGGGAGMINGKIAGLGEITGHGGGGGHGAAAPDPLEIIQKEMEQYKPAIRDAIISVLSSKTAEELAGLAGKELSKEQIKSAVNPLFGGRREVLRVSFGTFIIQ